MPRYSTRPRASDWFDNDGPLIPDCNVDEHVARFTGLLDASGEEIWCEPRPIGFGRDGEW
jgi:hypothetical protein